MAKANPEPAAVAGELVEAPEAAVIPSDAEQNAGADRARGRTVTQVGLPGALVAIGSWFARLHGLDFNPLPGEAVDLPPEIVSALIVVASWLMVVRMNPKTKA